MKCLISTLLLLISVDAFGDDPDALKAEKDRLNNEIASLEQAKRDKENQVNRKRTELTAAANKETNLGDQLDTANVELANVNNQFVGLEAESEKLADNLESTRQQIADQELAKEQLSLRLEDLEKEQQNLTQETVRLSDENKDLQSDLKQNQKILAEQSQSNEVLLKELESEQAVEKGLIDLREKVDHMVNPRASRRVLDRRIGFIKGNEAGCSAYFVNQDTIRTAAHCIDDPKKLGERSDYIFETLGGDRIPLGMVTHLNLSQDMIELRVETVPDATPFIPFGYPDASQPLLMIFHNNQIDFTMVQVCSLNHLNEKQGYFTHSCPTEKGASGGVFIQEDRIVGFHVGRTDKHEGFGVSHLIDKEVILGEILGKIKFEATCDSNCVETINSPCPTATNWGRTCQTRISNPACEAEKALDCARRETAKALNALIDGLKRSISALSSKSGNLKISIQGLDRTLVDLNDALLGRNESVKGLIDDIAEVAAEIDIARAKVTSKVLFINEQKQLLANALKLLQLSGTDVKQIMTSIESVEKSNVQTIEKNTSLQKINVELSQSVSGVKGAVGRARSAGADIVNKTRETIGRNTETLADIGGYIGDAGQNIEREFNNLKQEVSVRNVEKITKKVVKAVSDTVVTNLGQTAGWLSDRLTPSASNGPSLERFKAKVKSFDTLSIEGNDIVVNNNNKLFALTLHGLLSGKSPSSYSTVQSGDPKFCKDYDSGYALCADPEAITDFFATAEYVCEKELAAAVVSGETGVHWVQVQPPEFCQLKYQHLDDRPEKGWARSANRARCIAVQSIQRLNPEFDNKPLTFRCKDFRPQMKVQRDRIKEQIAEINANKRPVMDTIYQELGEYLDDYRSEKNIQNEQEKARDLEKEKEVFEKTMADLSQTRSYNLRKLPLLLINSVTGLTASIQENFAQLSDMLGSEEIINDNQPCEAAMVERRLKLNRLYYILGTQLELLSAYSTETGQVQSEVDREYRRIREEYTDLQAVLGKTNSYATQCRRQKDKAIPSWLLDQGMIAAFDLAMLDASSASDQELMERRDNPEDIIGAVSRRVQRVKTEMDGLSDHPYISLIIFRLSRVQGADDFISITDTNRVGFSKPETIAEATAMAIILDQTEQMIRTIVSDANPGAER